MTDKILTRPATSADVVSFFGKTAPQTVRAYVMEREGEVVGIGGYHITNGVAVVFSEVKEGLPKLRVWREALAVMKRIGIPAICYGSAETGPFLERLGWQYVCPSEHGDVYQWQR